MTAQNNPKITLGAMGLPVDKQGKFLLIRGNIRPDGNGHDKWVTAGGIVKFGEDPLYAMRREVKEEIGTTSKLLFPYPIVKSHTFNPSDQVILLTYLIDIGSQPLKLDTKECSDSRWVTTSQVKDLDTLPLTYPIVKIAAEMVNQHGLLSLLS